MSCKVEDYGGVAGRDRTAKIRAGATGDGNGQTAASNRKETGKASKETAASAAGGVERLKVENRNRKIADLYRHDSHDGAGTERAGGGAGAGGPAISLTMRFPLPAAHVFRRQIFRHPRESGDDGMESAGSCRTSPPHDVAPDLPLHSIFHLLQRLHKKPGQVPGAGQGRSALPPVYRAFAVSSRAVSRITVLFSR